MSTQNGTEPDWKALYHRERVRYSALLSYCRKMRAQYVKLKGKRRHEYSKIAVTLNSVCAWVCVFVTYYLAFRISVEPNSTVTLALIGEIIAVNLGYTWKAKNENTRKIEKGMAKLNSSDDAETTAGIGDR